MTFAFGRFVRPTLLATLLLLLTPPQAWTATPAAPVRPGAPAFLPVEEIHAGMIGRARTVFEGDTLEDFDVEILGVLKNAIGPQQDMILARLKGAKVEFTGVVAGMSGSPVTIDGRLIGALSYRIGQFTKEPIAGITPIADMLKAGMGASPVSSTEPAAGGNERAETAPDLLGRFLLASGSPDQTLSASDRPGRGHPEGPGFVSSWAGDLEPIATPLICSGCDPGVLRYYAPIFEARGLTPMAGGGGTDTALIPSTLEPGSAVGGALVSGDLSLNGIGTLTHIDGKRVYAFGHPFLGNGPVAIPMTQAQVILTLSSAAGSFKIANATRPVGSLVEDRLTAIVGEIGRMAPTLPVQVQIGPAAGPRRLFRYDILRDRAWSPVMAALVIANSLTRSTDFDASATLRMKSRIDIEGTPGVVYEDLYAGTNAAQPVHAEVANDIGALFGLLYNNRFEEPKVRGITLDVEVLPRSRIAALSSVRASKGAVRPGEPFVVTAVLTPYRGEERQVSFEVRLPEDTPAGETEIIVGSGQVVDGLDRRILERQLTQAGGLDDLILLVGRQRRSDALYLRVARRSPSAIVRSEVLPDLPLSVFTVFNNPRLSNDATLMIDTPILEIARGLDLVAVGGRRISIKVK